MCYIYKSVAIVVRHRVVRTVLVSAAAAVLVTGCLTAPTVETDRRQGLFARSAALAGPDGAGGENARRPVSVSGTAVQEDIVRAAYSLVGSRTLRVRGERFTADCTGTVLAAYYAAGLDLRPYFKQHTGNGVTRLHKIGREQRLLSAGGAPEPGDVVFWDNTYDRNRNGRFDDPLTHAGVIVDVGPRGQLEYVHYNYARGVVVEQLNLRRPDTHRAGNELINSPMRLKSDRHMRPDQWLASHLFRDLASLHRLAR
jgi:hypothetical protein